jgi:hypothetical protein
MKVHERILVTTFKGKSSSGLVVEVGYLDVYVDTSMQQISSTRGCFDSELIMRQCDVVEVCGRCFILRNEALRGNRRQLALPQDVVKDLTESSRRELPLLIDPSKEN